MARATKRTTQKMENLVTVIPRPEAPSNLDLTLFFIRILMIILQAVLRKSIKGCNNPDLGIQLPSYPDTDSLIITIACSLEYSGQQMKLSYHNSVHQP